MLNLTQHIEDGFELGQIIGAAFIDLTTAYDTIDHRRLLAKLVMLTDDVPLTMFIRTMLSNRRFKVELNGKQSRWRNQRNGIPQGSVLSPLLFNVYTNAQPLPADTNSFMYADDLCTTQHNTFELVENTLDSGLNELGAYYKENHLRPHPAKTQLTAFHLKNRQADRKLDVTWNGTKLDHTHSPVYIGTTLDRSLAYRNHSLKTRANSPPETISRGSCMGRTGARAPTPRRRRRQHNVSPWRSIAVLSGPVPRIQARRHNSD